MAGSSKNAPLLGGDDSDATLPRQAESKAARFDQTCYGGDLPAWVATRPPAKVALSARTASKLTSSSLNAEKNSKCILLKRLLTVAETAFFFHVSEKTIRRMITRGELAVVRIGRSIRIDTEVIEKIARQNE
jgi:excisionase family DNA binding protein